MASGPYPRSDRELLQRVGRSAGGKAGYKQLVRELGLGGGRGRRLLVEQLTRMVARAELVQLEEGLWAIPRPEPRAGQPLPAMARAGTAGTTHPARAGRERLVSGRLDLHRDGFGFVRPEPGNTSIHSPGDIFIAPPDLNGAMQGDLVLVDEAPPGKEGRRSGSIARVLTRAHPTVVGVFHYARPQRRAPGDERFGLSGARGNFVVPIDERVAGFIEIPDGAESVEDLGASPHRMLGEQARQRRPASQAGSGVEEPSGAVFPAAAHQPGPAPRWPLEGMAVDVELTHFPAAGRPARGRVLEVLGKPDDFGVDVEIVIRKHHLPHTFPPQVLKEAEERAELSVSTMAASDPELTRREDFRGLPVVTIDGETARDFDDAVLVRPLANGNTELQVHIADVSAYVLPGSALDTEARVRGTSVYFPDRAVPMLPAALSSGMCSLRPDEDRLVLSCVMEIDARGEIAGYRVAEGMIRSVRRCTYTSVQRCLQASPLRESWNGGHAAAPDSEAGRSLGGTAPRIPRRVTPEPGAEDFSERERIGLEQPELPAAFDRMLDLALRLNGKRLRRGSIDFDLPEPVIEFDPDGNMKAIVRSERGWAHRLIEEFMLSANECVATWLTARGTPAVYRVHEMPDPKRVIDFEEQAAAFGQTLGVGTLPVRKLTMKADRREAQRRSGSGRRGTAAPMHEVPGAIEVTPQMYQRLVRRMSGKPEERILAYLMLRSLKQARYAEQNVGHFALASPCYTHFTSPIRRYPDLIVHRLVRALLRRGADGRGGAVLSTDEQSWKNSGTGGETRNAVRALTLVAGTSVRARTGGGNHSEERDSLDPGTRAGRGGGRVGRVGWSAEPGGSSSEGVESLQAASPHRLEPDEPPAGAESMSARELNDIAIESSQAERRAADAERELVEWKKMRFMADKIGDDFHAIILSITKYGFFVELDDMFVEGLVPIGSLAGDHYSFRETDRAICGARTGHCFRAGQRVQVILDRIDRQARRLQFALLPGTEPTANTGLGMARAGTGKPKKPHADGKSGKAPKTAARARKAKRRKT